MNITAAAGKEQVSTIDLMKRPTDDTITVPLKMLTPLESLAVGLKMNMIDLTDDDGQVGAVATGAGLGNDFITVEWRDVDGTKYTGAIRGADLLKAFVARVEPGNAEFIPNVTEGF